MLVGVVASSSSSAAATAPPPFNIQYDRRVDGDELPGSQIYVSANDTSACHAACEQNPGCVGWVIDTPNYHCLSPTEPPGKSSC